MRAVSQVLIATIALALGVQAEEQSNETPLVARQFQPPPPRASTLPPNQQQPGQQPGLLPPRQSSFPGQQQPGQQPGILPPRQSAAPQPKQGGGLLGNILGGNQGPQPGPQPGGLLGNLFGGNQGPQQNGPKQPGGLLGDLLGNRGGGQPGRPQPGPQQLQPPQQPKQPNQPKLPGGGGGGLLGNLFGPSGSTKPIAIKQCPPNSRCSGRNNACVPHPRNADQFLCVRVDDDCGGRRNRACPSGQACLADPRDRDACVNGWCNNVEGICVSPPS